MSALRNPCALRDALTEISLASSDIRCFSTGGSVSAEEAKERADEIARKAASIQQMVQECLTR